MAELSFIDKLVGIQTELKAPKNQFNKFGGYKYRSCEDILEAAKPHLKKYKMALTISDEIVNIGDRIYVKATARVEDGSRAMEVSAFAREPESKKGMDDSQITGTASSYARKYALNGLFAIDDTKDADSNEVANMGKQDANKAAPASKQEPPKKEVKCVFCGKPITGGKVKGKIITAEEVMDQSMTIFGDLFCYPCMIKKSEEKQKATGGTENA